MSDTKLCGTIAAAAAHAETALARIHSSRLGSVFSILTTHSHIIHATLRYVDEQLWFSFQDQDQTAFT